MLRTDVRPANQRVKPFAALHHRPSDEPSALTVDTTLDYCSVIGVPPYGALPSTGGSVRCRLFKLSGQSFLAEGENQ